jgi:uncharacterized protein (TIGR03437 family)
MKRIFFVFVCITPAVCQQPVITPGGVVNAASYKAGISPLNRGEYPQIGGGPALAPGSIGAIFGSNLASSPETARTLPLPAQLGGVSVSVNGFAAPLFFASPNQINFQVPARAIDNSGVVVTTAAGQSAAYPLDTGGIISAPGMFTLDSSGCGQGAILNVAPDGGVSLNSPSNSASPGNFISIYGTGEGDVNHQLADGAPAPNSPLAKAIIQGGPIFDFSAGGDQAPGFWAGRAPGLVGVDQFNWLVPVTARQGCTVPLQVSNTNISAPVTISIAAKGGRASIRPRKATGRSSGKRLL